MFTEKRAYEEAAAEAEEAEAEVETEASATITTMGRRLKI